MNAKIIKTKQALLEAICRLAETVPIQEITVTQLCQEAGINRTTFYRYYNIPMDVILQKTEELTEMAFQSALQSGQDSYECIRDICNVYYENRKMMPIYFNAGGDLFKIQYELLLRHSDHLQFLVNPVNNFIAGGVASSIMTWIIGGCATSPEALAEYIFNCISKLSGEK